MLMSASAALRSIRIADAARPSREETGWGARATTVLRPDKRLEWYPRAVPRQHWLRSAAASAREHYPAIQGFQERAREDSNL